MNKNINNALRKTSQGNYFGYYYGFYISVCKQMHGAWCVAIGWGGHWLWTEGFHGRSLPTLFAVKRWVRLRILG